MAVESGSYTPETIARRMKIAEAMLGDPQRPIQHWAEGLNELAKGYVGGKMLRDAETAESEGSKAQAAVIAALMGGGGMPGAAPAGVPASLPPPAGAAPAPRPPVDVPMPARGDGEIPLPRYRPEGMAGGQARPPIQQATEGIISAIDPVEGDIAPRINAAGARPAAPMPAAGAPPAGMPPAMPAPPATGAVPPAGSPDVRAKIAAMLSSPDPYVRRQAMALAGPIIAQSAQGPKYGKLNDDTLYDERTGRTVTAGEGYRPLVDPAERARYGIPKDDQRPYQIGPANKLISPPPETRLAIDQRQESSFSNKSGGLQAERFNELVKGGMEAQGLIADINNLREIGGRLQTGKTTEIKGALGPYVEALGIKVDGLDDIQAYNAIVSRLAPRMRVAGSGATSDFEMQTFLKGLPGVARTPGGNELISQTLEMIQEHRIKAAEIGSRAMAGEISPRDAEKELRALPDPLALWKKSRGQGATAAPARAQPQDNGPVPPELEAEMRRRGLLK